MNTTTATMIMPTIVTNAEKLVSSNNKGTNKSNNISRQEERHHQHQQAQSSVRSVFRSSHLASAAAPSANRLPQFPSVPSTNLMRMTPALMVVLCGALFALNTPQCAQALPIAAMDGAGGNSGADKVYFATLLRGVDGRSALVPLSGTRLFRLLAAPSPLIGGGGEQQQKKRRDLGGGGNGAAAAAALDRQMMLAKKYDRNCFFSPVQCTLQQWNDGNSAADEVLLGGGVRK